MISAVGHEPDVTISDFVADLRAATPSNAAELAVPDQMELRQALAARQALLLTQMQKRLKQERGTLERLASSRVLKSPINYINDRRLQVDYVQHRLTAAFSETVQRKHRRFASLTAKLDAMSPLKVLARGYSMASDGQGTLLRSVKQIKPGDRLTVRFADGSAAAVVEEVNP